MLWKKHDNDFPSNNCVGCLRITSRAIIKLTHDNEEGGE